MVWIMLHCDTGVKLDAPSAFAPVPLAAYKHHTVSNTAHKTSTDLHK